MFSSHIWFQWKKENKKIRKRIQSIVIEPRNLQRLNDLWELWRSLKCKKAGPEREEKASPSHRTLLPHSDGDLVWKEQTCAFNKVFRDKTLDPFHPFLWCIMTVNRRISCVLRKLFTGYLLLITSISIFHRSGLKLPSAAGLCHELEREGMEILGSH